MSASLVAENLDRVHAVVAAAARAAGRDPGRVRLIAVAKTATPATLQAAWDAGQRRFGHNRVQMLEAHHAVLPEAEWHMIGPLQSNKARRALALARVVQTIGDLKIAAVLDRVLGESDEPPPECLVQVNLTPEDGRYGCTAEALPALLEEIRNQTVLRPSGLMTIGPHGASEDVLRAHYSRLRELAEGVAARGILPADPELSMGMTDDYKTAVAEGATVVRVGRAIFPAEPPSQDG